jgi:hypothetical protein
MEVSMFKRVLAILPALCLAASVASAQSPFIGAWKLDPLKSRMPDEMKVESKGGNTYVFDFGAGPETIVADGSDQPGMQDTLLAVKAAGPGTWTVQRKKDGRVWIKATWTLSKDGTLTDNYRQFEADGSTVSMDYVYQRAGEGSGIAGDWQSIKETMNSPFALQVKVFQGDGLTFVSPVGTTNATVEDKDHPSGEPSIRRMDDHTLMVTIRHGGKEAATEEFVLSPDRKTLTMTVRVVGKDKPEVLVFERTA